jgi:methyltransferase (TIGR00027 family)
MTQAKLENVSDTALWVAVYRAMESERPDALFHDPHARRLAGTRGEEILKSLKATQFSWPMVVRTAVMDEIILRSIREDGVDTVVNLACGLDARAFRLELPSTLSWFDVDLPGMIAHRTEHLRNEKPHCRYEAITADLKDPAARKSALSRATTAARKALVVTEGLLVYLTEEQVSNLARELASFAPIRLWLIDIASPRLLRMLNRRFGSKLAAADSLMKFGPADSTRFFEPLGFREREFRSTFDESIRLNRAMKLAWLWRIFGRLQPARKREEMRRMGGIALLERS